MQPFHRRPRSRSWRSSFLLSAVATLLSAATSSAQATPVIELRNAHWFDGTRFVTGSRWMQGGDFVREPTLGADSTIDLRRAYVIPPFGDAHTHSPDGARGFEAIRDMYLRLGVFYVQSLTNTRSGRREIAARVNVPTSVDVAFADAAVTSTGGHPHVLYESLGLYRRFWQTDVERFAAARSLARDHDVYERLDSLAQLAPLIARLARDTVPVLKVMLLDSERWDARHRDSTQVGFYGMNPELLPALVEAAHAQRKRVWAHVETPADMAIALHAGVDGFAHVAGYDAAHATDSLAPMLLLPDSTIRLAGSRHVPMTATLVLGATASASDTAQRRRFMAVTVRNARALRAAGVVLLAGSDTYSNADFVRNDPIETAKYLDLSTLELLRLWAVDTPRAIFPGRRIAQLAPTFEASALVLACDPLRETACLSKITMRLKQGRWIDVPSVAVPAR